MIKQCGVQLTKGFSQFPLDTRQCVFLDPDFSCIRLHPLNHLLCICLLLFLCAASLETQFASVFPLFLCSCYFCVSCFYISFSSVFVGLSLCLCLILSLQNLSPSLRLFLAFYFLGILNGSPDFSSIFRLQKQMRGDFKFKA